MFLPRRNWSCPMKFGRASRALAAACCAVLVFCAAHYSFGPRAAGAERVKAVVENPGLANADGNWARFRGPNGSGISFDKDIAVEWTESDFLWKVRIPGTGHSSPCVWDDFVFVCTATDDGLERALVCLDAASGDTRWTRKLPFKVDKKHQKNSYASCTPATDGERVYVAFSSMEQYRLFAFDFEGKQLWHYDLGPYQSQHGSGTSPIVFEDLVLLGNDQDGPSSIEIGRASCRERV